MGERCAKRIFAGFFLYFCIIYLIIVGEKCEQKQSEFFFYFQSV
jgi:hypothetical protein